MAFERGVEQVVQLLFYDKSSGDLSDPENIVIEYFKDATDADSINSNRLTIKTGKGVGLITLTAEEMTCDMGSLIVTSTNCRPSAFSFYTESNYTGELAGDLGGLPESVSTLSADVGTIGDNINGIDGKIDGVESKISEIDGKVDSVSATLSQSQGMAIASTRTQ